MRHRIGFTLRFFSRMYLAFKCSGIGSICNSIYSFFWWNKRSRVLRIQYGEWDDFGWANTSTVIGDWFLIFVQVAKSAIEINCLYSDIFCFLCNIFVESISYSSATFNSFNVKHTLLMIWRNFWNIALRHAIIFQRRWGHSCFIMSLDMFWQQPTWVVKWFQKCSNSAPFMLVCTKWSKSFFIIVSLFQDVL